MDANAGQRKKITHQLDTPFSTISWPEISQADQDEILEVLCSLLAPIGNHRCTHVKASKGKKATRKQPPTADSGSAAMDLDPPPPPDLIHSVDVGLNSITRNLRTDSNETSSTEEGQTKSRQYSMVFVSRGDQSSAFNCHFPKMVCAASKDKTNEESIRLVGFSKPCSERLSSCLGIARVSSLAIVRGAPGTDALWKMVKRSVDPIDGKWLEGNADPGFLSTQINAIETTIGPKRPKKQI